MLPAILTTLLFSISGITGTRLTKYFGGTEANFWRLCLATLLLGIYAHIFGLGLAGEALPVFLISGIIGFGLGDVALFQSYKRIGSRLTILIVHCLAAPMAATIEWTWLGTRLTGAQIAFAITILFGVSLALAPSEHIQATKREWIAGILWGVLAAFGQGFGAVLSRKAYEVATNAGYQIDGINAAYQRIIGGLLVTGLCLLFLKVRFRTISLQNKTSFSPASNGAASRSKGKILLVVLINALSGPALGVSCFQWALLTTPTGIVLPIIALTPLVIIPFARFFEGEKPTVRSLIGGVIAVGGVIALSRQ